VMGLAGDGMIMYMATESLVDEANLLLDRFASIGFHVDENLGKVVVHVRACSDCKPDDSDPLIRTVHGEALLELSKKTQDLKRLLFDKDMHKGLSADTTVLA